jgi:hypothetical protein
MSWMLNTEGLRGYIQRWSKFVYGAISSMSKGCFGLFN